MSSFLNEESFRVSPLSSARIEAVAQAALLAFCPEVLASPQPVPIARLVDEILPRSGIHFYPATGEELGNREAATDPTGGKGDEIVVLVEQRYYDALFSHSRDGNRARSTVGHELGHVFLHVPMVRDLRAQHSGQNVMLARAKRGDLAAFEDAEAQAWAFARFFLMPTQALLTRLRAGQFGVAGTFGVSEAMLQSRLKRMR